MRESAVHQGCEQNTGQAQHLARPDAEVLDPQVERPVQQLDAPDQYDEAEREPDREAKIAAGALGIGESGIGGMDLHPAQDISRASRSRGTCAGAKKSRTGGLRPCARHLPNLDQKRSSISQCLIAVPAGVNLRLG